MVRNHSSKKGILDYCTKRLHKEETEDFTIEHDTSIQLEKLSFLGFLDLTCYRCPPSHLQDLSLPYSISYLFGIRSIPGKFLPQKAKELKIPKVYTRGKKGESRVPVMPNWLLVSPLPWRMGRSFILNKLKLLLHPVHDSVEQFISIGPLLVDMDLDSVPHHLLSVTRNETLYTYLEDQYSSSLDG